MSFCGSQLARRISFASLLKNAEADVVAATHSGIKWSREVDEGSFVNVGVLGRPENDGTTNVWYTLLEHTCEAGLQIEFVPVHYDHDRLAREMREEKIPEEFVETVLGGWWTTCLEVLPGKERKAGKY